MHILELYPCIFVIVLTGSSGGSFTRFDIHGKMKVDKLFGFSLNKEVNMVMNIFLKGRFLDRQAKRLNYTPKPLLSLKTLFDRAFKFCHTGPLTPLESA